MTRCTDFYEKWKRHPNFCEKSPKTVDEIDYYLTIVEELVQFGLDETAVYVGFSEGASRPLQKVTDEVNRTKILANIAGKINRGSPVTVGDVKTWIDLAEGKIRANASDAKPAESKTEPLTPEDPPKPRPTPATVATIAHAPVEQVQPIETVTPEEDRANEHAAKMAEKFPLVKGGGTTGDEKTDTPPTPPKVNVKTPPNVIGAEPVFPEEETWVLKRGLQIGIATRIKEGFAKNRLDAYDRALEFWINNIRDYTEGAEA
jgi:hypothetical protein